MPFEPFETQIPTALGDMVARFTIYAEPKVIMVDSDVETPIMEHARDEEGNLLFEDENGDPTTTVTATPVIVQATDPNTGEPAVHTTVERVAKIDPDTGEPAVRYAVAKINVNVLDQNGDVMGNIKADQSEFSDQVGNLLISALMQFRMEKAAEMSIAPSPAAL